MNSVIFPVIAEAFRILLKRPLLLLALQWPDLLSEMLISFTRPYDYLPWVNMLVVFPLTWLLTVISTAATFAFFRSQGQASFTSCFKQVALRIQPLMLTGLITGVAVALGLLIILPAIYFVAIYLFVPCVVLARPQMNVFEALAHSTRLTRKAIWSVLAFAVVVIVWGLLMGQVESALEAQGLGQEVSYLIKAVIALSLSAWVNSIISLLYFRLDAAPDKAL